VEEDRPFHTDNGEVSVHLEHVAACLFTFGTPKKNMGVFFHIEKIGTSEMVISGFNASENARRIYRNLCGRTGYIRWVKFDKTGNLVELTVNVIDHYVAHREMSHRMIGVDNPFGHLETPPSSSIH
jgi:hypothetical protein